MPRPPKNKPVTNEIKYPYVVELAAVGDGLDVELSRRIMQFHKSRHIQLRYGRRINTKRGKTYYRWRFSDYRSLAPLPNSLAETLLSCGVDRAARLCPPSCLRAMYRRHSWRNGLRHGLFGKAPLIRSKDCCPFPC
jgi:hypothetical protein